MYSLVLMAALTTGGNAPDFGRHHGSCSGCSCSCSCYGCYGCHGCYGYGCHGCCSCYGGYGCYGCYGCHGCTGWYNCFGCYGGWSCYGCHGCSGYNPVYVVPQGAPPSIPKSEEAPPPKKEKLESSLPNRARLVVQVPADAKLFIDDVAMKSTSSTRTFVTPALRPGQTYFYDLRAEIVRDGRTVSQTRRVILRPGEAIQASFSLSTQPNATAQTEN